VIEAVAHANVVLFQAGRFHTLIEPQAVDVAVAHVYLEEEATIALDHDSPGEARVDVCLGSRLVAV
jgi:hypothetical protein